MKGMLFMAMVVAFGTAAMAEVPMTFEDLDRDANGYISQSEAAARKDLKAGFAAIDRDGDGRLTIGEYQAYEGKGRMSPPEESEVPEPGAAPY
ncbi:MAG: calmodulin [Chromatiales bacterium]|nr:calmodulin [Chromatiales bacterium]